ncbi:uncharacterized protein LOC133799654 [Humulus lupulus]|uniref:uncharacterized protein LOC133799654 n=1 Tax=Humulus lupulus TaxID=3486 RepID=UPI002B411FE1|nr:uncharacterized protein LOC133799654 [Humulus lupulus]
MRKLDILQSVLHKFNKVAIGDVTINYSVAKEQFQQAHISLQQNPHLVALKDNARTAGLSLSFHSRIYESFIRQKSKITWLQFGDKNSAYFHACLNTEKKASWPFMKKDVKSTLFYINSINSPGPDGFGAGFYKFLWKDLGDEISNVILGFFDKGELPYDINNITLTLIPKVANPSKAVDFRPIACCYNRRNISHQCVMKIDLSKAYDTIDWLFLEDLLKAFCFPSRFIHCIMDGFSQFSDASGLSVNLAKSHVYFGGLIAEDKKNILDCLNIEEGSIPLKYLSIPLRPTKWKAGDCGIILKKINLRLHSWASRHLSFAGQAQLIHFVLLGIRSYWMSIFLLPQSVTLEIDRLCRNFLWGSTGNRSKLHFTAWDHVCLSKSLGGIGFKEGLKWNKVLLAKYVWAISSKQDLLWVKWVDNIYLKGVNFWPYNLMAGVSWYWRKLVYLKSFLSREILEAAATGRTLHLSRLYFLLLQQSKQLIHKIEDWLGVAIWSSKYCEWIVWMAGRPKAISSNRAVCMIKASLTARLLGIARKKLGTLEKTILDSMSHL